MELLLCMYPKCQRHSQENPDKKGENKGKLKKQKEQKGYYKRIKKKVIFILFSPVSKAPTYNNQLDELYFYV